MTSLSKHEATFLQKMDFDAMEGKFNSVTLTSHPNLLNLIGKSVFKSNIILYYFLSYISYKLQLYDVGVFSPLKIAYQI